MEIAAAKGLTSLAFPSISTGIYGYPVELAAQVAVASVRQALQQPSSVTEVFAAFRRRTSRFTRATGRAET